MAILTRSDKLSLEELLDGIRNGEVRINSRYQRSGKIWPPKAKSFLVESVILGMPIPRILLHDVEHPTPPHNSDIIDGQQRSTVLLDFREGRFALNSACDSESLHGKRFADLSPKQKAAFDNYVVAIDRYSAVTEKQIRQVFRRLNFYTAPLNAAEQRHAQFAGEFSRFVDDQALLWAPTFDQLRVFTSKQKLRRAREQLLAEVVDTMLEGFTTPTAASLRTTFGRHDREFASVANFRGRLGKARLQIDKWRELRGMKITKPYHMYALMLATMHSLNSIAAIRDSLGASLPVRGQPEIVAVFRHLDDAFRSKAESGPYSRFWWTCAEGTNVRDKRELRTQFFYAALTGTSV